MTSTVALFLAQDGIINGAVYALLGVTLVLLFAVTRVIFVPQGEFVAWGALTVAALEAGNVPGTAWLLMGLGVSAAVLDLLRDRQTLAVNRIHTTQKLIEQLETEYGPIDQRFTQEIETITEEVTKWGAADSTKLHAGSPTHSGPKRSVAISWTSIPGPGKDGKR